jgi:hypothetical protein
LLNMPYLSLLGHLPGPLTAIVPNSFWLVDPWANPEFEHLYLKCSKPECPIPVRGARRGAVSSVTAG